jgi:DNA gyrase/topoisomerase IV subunit A
MIAVRDLEDENSFLVFATKKGIVKRSALSNAERLTIPFLVAKTKKLFSSSKSLTAIIVLITSSI